MKHVVSQEIVFDLLLFLLYINYFKNCFLEFSNIILIFADGSAFPKFNKDTIKFWIILSNKQLNIIDEFNFYFIGSNINKTIFTVFSYLHLHSDINILLGNK